MMLQRNPELWAQLRRHRQSLPQQLICTSFLSQAGREVAVAKEVPPWRGDSSRTGQAEFVSGCSSEFCGLGEIEVADLHGRNNHVHRFLATGSHRLAHRLDILQHVDEAFVEAEVANASPD